MNKLCVVAAAFRRDVSRPSLPQGEGWTAACPGLKAAAPSSAASRHLLPEGEGKRPLLAAGLIAMALALVAADEPAPMVVAGRVLGADGQPAAGARVLVLQESYGRSRRPNGVYNNNGLPWDSRFHGPFAVGPDGRYEAKLPIDSARPALFLYAVAAAPGQAAALRDLDTARKGQQADFRLEREHIVRARIIDLQGQPVVDAEVRVVKLRPEKFTVRDDRPADDAFAALRSAKTDDKGRFLIHGLSSGTVVLQVAHPRFPTQRLNVEAVDAESTKEEALSLAPGRPLRGRVTREDTGEPLAGAEVFGVTDGYAVSTKTGADGVYTLNPFPGANYGVTVYAPDGEPYAPRHLSVASSQAGKEVDIPLPRGVLVRGKVTEAGSGRPVAAARVQQRPRWRDNPHYNNARIKGPLLMWDWEHEALPCAMTKDDGTFELAALPGPGALFVLGPTLDYLHVETSTGALEYGRPSMLHYYPDALVPLDLKSGSGPHKADVTLRRGATLRASVVLPDGKPASRFRVLARSYLPMGWELFQRSNILECRDGILELPGCDPEAGGTAWLFDEANRLGATLEFTGKQLGGTEPVAVRLQPCGSAAIRCIDPAGKPVAGQVPQLMIVFSPGTYMAFGLISEKDDKDLEGDWLNWSNLDRERYRNLTPSDADGRVTLPDLIPGATYWTATFEAPFDERKGLPKIEFTAKSGESVKVPDLVVGRPK